MATELVSDMCPDRYRALTANRKHTWAAMRSETAYTLLLALARPGEWVPVHAPTDGQMQGAIDVGVEHVPADTCTMTRVYILCIDELSKLGLSERMRIDYEGSRIMFLGGPIGQ